MLALSAGDYELTLAPERGGSILRLDWRGEPLMRPACGPSILDVACFPLVPFSNRIAHGRFFADGREVSLRPNLPDIDHSHPLHGFGWLAQWSVADSTPRSATLLHDYTAGEWPWAYVASQSFQLDENGLTILLCVTNLGISAMPSGLGFHPYFPRDPDTRYVGFHRGEWRNAHDCLPTELSLSDEPRDWWDGQPVSSRTVDTVYVGRTGALCLAWPSRGISLRVMPSPQLDHTHVFTPPGSDFFCVEPVSHATNAIHSPGAMKWLAPGETFAVNMRLEAFASASPAR
jgi:aldose 1-epimerase